MVRRVHRPKPRRLSTKTAAAHHLRRCLLLICRGKLRRRRLEYGALLPFLFSRGNPLKSKRSVPLNRGPQ